MKHNIVKIKNAMKFCNLFHKYRLIPYFIILFLIEKRNFTKKRMNIINFDFFNHHNLYI